MDKRLISYISLCRKAGYVVTGEESCEKAISAGNAELVLVANDASDNTKKKFRNKAEFYGVRHAVTGTRAELSGAIGKENRPALVITDKGLSDRIWGLLKD